MAGSKVVQLRPNSKIKAGAEYVSGSPYLSEHPRVLPTFNEFDTLNNVLTHETIDCMLTDPDVFASLMLLSLMTLNEKLLISAAIEPEKDDTVPAAASATPPTDENATDGAATSTDTPKDNIPLDNAANSGRVPASPAKPIDPKAQLASDIADFCQRQVDRVAKFHTTMFQMVFEGMAHGNKVAEQVLEIAARGEDKGRWCLKAIKPKPRHAVAFVVDAYNNEIGLLGAKPGQMAVVQTTIVADDRDIIPREKFAVFTYRPKDSDPRGNTALLAARNGWELKQRTFPEYLLFLMVSAIPGILATLPAGQDEITVYEDDGLTPKKDPTTGEVITISAHQFLLNMLGKMRNHQVGVAPEGTTFTLLEANNEGEVFTRALDKFGSEITMATLFQHLATRDATHQTKGATSSQFQIVDLIVFWLRDTAAEMVRGDIFKPLVRYNFGDDAADELLPIVSYGDTEARDWAVDAAAAAQLASNLSESQWEHITRQLGIPAPTEAEKALKQQAKALLQQSLSGNGEGDNAASQKDKGVSKPPTGDGAGVNKVVKPAPSQK